MIVTHYLAKIWLKLNMVENADIPRPCEANQEENEWSRDKNNCIMLLLINLLD